MDKIKRPKVTQSVTEKVATGCGNAYITPSYIDGEVKEVFVHLGKAGGCAIAQSEAMCRCISIGLRYGIPLEEYVEQLRGISCPSPTVDEGVIVKSCVDAIAKTLSKCLKVQEAVKDETTTPET